MRGAGTREQAAAQPVARSPIAAVAPWVGSDDGMQAEIQRQLGPAESIRWYVELFAGGCRTLLSKAPSAIEWVNDLHPALINLLNVLASRRAVELDQRLALTVYGDAIYAAAIEEYRATAEDAPGQAHCITDADLDRAWATWVIWWQGRGGTAGGRREGTISIRWKHEGGHGASRYRTACDSIAWLAERMARVHVWQRDGVELALRIEDRPGTVIYADPTFIGKEHNYAHGLASRPDDAGLALDDHDRLAEALNRFTPGGKGTRVVLRYYDHPRLRALYPAERWQVIDCARRKLITNQTGTETHAPDVLLVNGEVYE